MKTDPNDAAFPGVSYGDGLTKREYFAACAMMGFCAEPEKKIRTPSELDHVHRIIADVSVKQADALIEALNAEKKE